MRIVQTRRISQVFFLLLFFWFCVVATPGEQFFQLPGWPVNWFLQLDPLVGLATVFTTGKLYGWLAWGAATIILTILLGRFFCGWICPFGTLHHFIGYLAHRRAKARVKVENNRYRSLQRTKYYILVLFLAVALYPGENGLLLTGLLDPIPLVSRSVNLFILPIVDKTTGITSVSERLYQGGWLLGFVFLAALAANAFIPRLYCRFLCPLGALFGLCSRLAIWRIGKLQQDCSDCKMCERSCEGACSPSTNIRTSECVLCCNCIDPCPDKVVTYQALNRPAGEERAANISRRGFALSLVSGFLAAPAFGLAGKKGANWDTGIIRPPGALVEDAFLQRCIKCGQCMRVCPTNVLQPLGLEHGLEAVWTPTLNNRIGSSGCQLNCTQCSQVCPTAAIRPITLNEKLGINEHVEKGPIKMGTAFFDRGRCLPWAMDKPCIVCEENCPLSPKAIFTRKTFVTVRGGSLQVQGMEGARIDLRGSVLTPGAFGTGDYYCLLGEQRYKILANGGDFLMLADQPILVSDEIVSRVVIQILLQRPYVDIERCTGCGVCEHECPVNGKKAVRVSAEGETRNPKRALLLRKS